MKSNRHKADNFRKQNTDMTNEKQTANDSLSGQARSLENLIEYQKDSVVSKTIIGKKTGTVTLFAFDSGQGLSEHTAPFDALVYITDGEAEVTIEDHEVTVKKGEMIILPANKAHSIKALSRYKMLLVMIKS